MWKEYWEKCYVFERFNENRITGKCCHKLPIEVNNLSKRMVGKIIKELAVEINCNELIQHLYYIKNKYVVFTPYLTVKTVPRV